MSGWESVSLYHPERHVDEEDCRHPTKRQTLEDAAAGVWAVASLSRTVFFPRWIQEAQNIQLHGAPLHRGHSRHKQLSHQRWTIPEEKQSDHYKSDYNCFNTFPNIGYNTCELILNAV